MKLAKIISAQYSNVKYSIWETGWLNEFSRHQASKQIIIIEIENDFTESLYYLLKDSTRFDLYLNPDGKVIELYVSESVSPVIIKKLITRSPLVKRTEKKVTFYTPQIEKILVDVFVAVKLFYMYQGSELVTIYENAIANYTVNFTRLFGYAKRREREPEIKSFLSKNMHHLVKDLIDD